MIELAVAEFLGGEEAALVDRLAGQAIAAHRRHEATQLRAWAATLRCLRAALAGWEAAAGWRLVLEYPLRRLGRRLDAVLVTPRAVLVIEVKENADRFAAEARRQVEDYALDLQDFHAGSRGRVIVPILLATAAVPGPQGWPLGIGGVAAVLEAGEAISAAVPLSADRESAVRHQQTGQWVSRAAAPRSA